MSVVFYKAFIEIPEESPEQHPFILVFLLDQFVKAFLSQGLDQKISTRHFEVGVAQMILVEESWCVCTVGTIWETICGFKIFGAIAALESSYTWREQRFLFMVALERIGQGRELITHFQAKIEAWCIPKIDLNRVIRVRHCKVCLKDQCLLVYLFEVIEFNLKNRNVRQKVSIALI